MENQITIIETSEILSIHERGYNTRITLAKYLELINEVKFYISNGWSKIKAINFVLFEEFDFMFSDDSDRELLKGWMLNKMKTA